MIILIIDVIASIIWLNILIRLDAHSIDKKSIPALLSFFFAGMGSIIPALFLYRLFPDIPYNGDIMNILVDNIFIVGPVEEFSKFIVFYILSKKLKSVKEPRDGILQAASVGLGFAIIENFTYGIHYGPSVLVVRSIFCIAGHMTYASIWGFYTTMIRYESKNALVSEDPRDTFYIFLSIIPAALIHGFYNVLVDIRQPGPAILLTGLNIGFAIILYRVLVARSPFKKYPLSDYKKAINVLRHALKVHPDSFILNQRIALFFLYAGYYDLSLKHLNKCLKLKQDNSYSKAFKGIVLMLSGESEQGKKLLRTSTGNLDTTRRKILIKNITRLIKNDDIKKELVVICKIPERTYP